MSKSSQCDLFLLIQLNFEAVHIVVSRRSRYLKGCANCFSFVADPFISDLIQNVLEKDRHNAIRNTQYAKPKFDVNNYYTD